MTDHKPECQRWFTDMPEPDECPACEMFRACEQRIEAEWLARYNYDPDLVWEDALDVARQAVKAICHQHPLIWPTDEGSMQALDAVIDALQEEGTKEYVYRSSWSAALDAAREAVKNLRHSDDCYYAEGVLCHCEIKPALAAIDALREGKP